MTIEILHRPAQSATDRAPLLFVHGSFSGAWVWDVHFLPWFAARGWPVHALSLRGHGSNAGSVDLYGLADYVDDLARAVDQMDRPPVLIGHSLGGMVVQKYAVGHAVPAMVLMASVPPSGITTSAWHMVLNDPYLLWQINMLQTLGPQAVDPTAIYRSLFSDATPMSEVVRYMPYLQMESRRANMDLLAPMLPPKQPEGAAPCLVLGGDADAYIPVSALEETARFHHADLQILPGLPHGMMLDRTWETAAKAVAEWLEGRGF